MEAAPPHALTGILVLDLGRVLAAPWAGQTLGDLGAEVIKIERTKVGDDARTYGVISPEPGRPEYPSTFHACANRNKRSLELDLSDPRGAAIVRQLAAKADVLIENFLPGVMESFGLGYETLRAENPRLIYCSVTGYGQTGPYAKRPGYDGVFQAQSGLMEVTGLGDEEPGGGPMKTGPSMIDVTTGLVATISILAALAYRDRVSGKGQHIDTTLIDSAMAAQSSIFQEHLLTGRQPPRKGTEGNGGQPARIFECADQKVYISAGHQRHYEGLVAVLDSPELLTNPLFTTPKLRAINRLELADRLDPLIASWQSNDLVEALVKAKVPATVVNNYKNLMADPHMRHRGLSISMPTHDGSPDDMPLIASPIRLSDSPVTYRRSPPRLGEHSAEILSEFLGMDENEIEGLRVNGVI